MASEDIGLANPALLGQAVAAYQATQLIGMPECDVSSLYLQWKVSAVLKKSMRALQCILAQVVVALAESPKSIRTYSGYQAAKSLVKDNESYPVRSLVSSPIDSYSH